MRLLRENEEIWQRISPYIRFKEVSENGLILPSARQMSKKENEVSNDGVGFSPRRQKSQKPAIFE